MSVNLVILRQKNAQEYTASLVYIVRLSLKNNHIQTKQSGGIYKRNPSIQEVEAERSVKFKAILD